MIFDDNRDLTILELTTLSKKKLGPQKWSLCSDLLSKLRFPSAPSSITTLKYTDRFFLYPSLSEDNLSSFRKRGVISRYHHLGNRLKISILRKIFKRTKNLKSLFLESDANFKGIRRLRGLQDLSLTINTSQILEYPELLKHLISLQKVELKLRWLDRRNDPEVVSEFFGFLLNLPKLQHLTVWLHQSRDYYKILLKAIHEKNLPSFEIIVLNVTIETDLPRSMIDWSNYIDTLYISPMSSEDLLDLSNNKWCVTKKPEKILRFSYSFNFNEEEDFKNGGGGAKIKNFAATNLFSDKQDNSAEDAQSFLKFISSMKALENFTLCLGSDLDKSSDVASVFLEQISQIKSLESLRNFTFHFNDGQGIFLKAPPPYGNFMKNLKNLHLILIGHWLNISDWTEALKSLVSLERFYFVHLDMRREGKGDLNFSFGALQNLKVINLYYGDSFVESSMGQLIESISQVKNLESLEVSGRIFYDLDKKKVDAFVEDLCLKKNLESVSLIWKETTVMIQKVNGKLVVSSKSNRRVGGNN